MGNRNLQKLITRKLLDSAVMDFLREYGPLSPSKRKDTPTGRILAASAASLAEELLDRIGRKRKLTEVSVIIFNLILIYVTIPETCDLG